MKGKSKKNRREKEKYSQNKVDLISQRAYYIWESKGRPENTSLIDWLDAEEELKNEGLL